MSALVLFHANALLAGSSATGSDDARPMTCSTPLSAPRSWQLPTAFGAASTSIALADSHDQKHPDLDPITAARAAPPKML